MGFPKASMLAMYWSRVSCGIAPAEFWTHFSGVSLDTLFLVLVFCFSLTMSALCTVFCTSFEPPFVLSFVPSFVLYFVGYKIQYFVHSPRFFEGTKSISPSCLSSDLALINAFSLIFIIPLMLTLVLENQSDQLDLLFIINSV